MLTESLGTTECKNGKSVGANRIIGTTEYMNGESMGANRMIGYNRMHEWRIIGC